MNKELIPEAVYEAHRFLMRVSEWEDAVSADEEAEKFGRPKEMAALIRASLDLTRALVKMRRSPYD